MATAEITVSTSAARELYFLMLRDTAPVWNYQLAGQTFHRFTFTPSRTNDDVPSQIHKGGFEYLTAKQAQAIRDGMKHRVIQWQTVQSPRGPIRVGEIVSTNRDSFQVTDEDEPLANHLVFRKVTTDANGRQGPDAILAAILDASTDALDEEGSIPAVLNVDDATAEQLEMVGHLPGEDDPMPTDVPGALERELRARAKRDGRQS